MCAVIRPFPLSLWPIAIYHCTWSGEPIAMWSQTASHNCMRNIAWPNGCSLADTFTLSKLSTCLICHVRVFSLYKYKRSDQFGPCKTQRCYYSICYFFFRLSALSAVVHYYYAEWESFSFHELRKWLFFFVVVVAYSNWPWINAWKSCQT